MGLYVQETVLKLYQLDLDSPLSENRSDDSLKTSFTLDHDLPHYRPIFRPIQNKHIKPTSPVYINHLSFFTNHTQHTLAASYHTTTATMLLIGLTGSIATGKSTVSSILTSPPYSLPIIDADVIARQVVAPGTAGYNKIVAHFGPNTPDLLLTNEPEPIPGKGHYLNRPALGRRVFGDSPERARDRAVLNGIVHPAVRWEMYSQLLRHYLSGAWAVVLDVPLLFESGLDSIVGTVMVVSVSDPSIQMDRLMKRDSHLTSEDARNRVLSQGDVRDKARRCLARNSDGGVVEAMEGVEKQVGGPRGYVLYNDTDIPALKNQIADVMGRIQQGSPKWWAWLLLLFPPAAGLAGIFTFLRNKKINEAWKRHELETKAKL